MAELAGVTYERVPGYPKEYLSNRQASARDKLQCNWADRVILAEYLLGFVSGSVLYLPALYLLGDKITLYCMEVSIESLGETPTNETAQLAILYEIPPYDIQQAIENQTTTYVTEAIEPANEFITLSNKGLHWASITGPELEDTEAPAKVIRMVDWVYTIHHLPSLPAWIWTHPGAVNSATVWSETLGKSFAAGTLLCGNPSTRREITSAGVTAWTITVRLLYRPDGWNKFPRVGTAGTLAFETIYDDTAAKNVYDTANFASIIL